MCLANASRSNKQQSAIDCRIVEHEGSGVKERIILESAGLSLKTVERALSITSWDASVRYQFFRTIRSSTGTRNCAFSLNQFCSCAVALSADFVIRIPMVVGCCGLFCTFDHACGKVLFAPSTRL